MYLFSKSSLEVAEFKCNVNEEVKNIESVELVEIQPQTATPLQVNYRMLDCLCLNVGGGEDGTTYRVKFLVKGSDEERVIDCVIVVNDTEMNPLMNSSHDTFHDLVGRMQAGESTVSTVIFPLDIDVDPSNGEVYWDLINSEGAIISSGNGFSYDYEITGMVTHVRSQCVIVCPSYVEPTAVDHKYEIRYKLLCGGREYVQFEALTVYSSITVPIGAQDIVELKGNKTTVSIVLPKLYENCQVGIYQDNTCITGTKELKDPTPVSSGWLYSASLNTKDFPVALDSYDVVFEFWDNENEVNSESCKLWVINPSIRSAADDMLAKIHKARASLYGALDLIYTMPTVLTWMRRGRDLFNGWQGIFTNFTMTNAKGVIREYWLMCSELGALESQYLAEGEKAFDFSGAAISLNVDRTGVLQGMADTIRSVLDQNLKPIKQSMLQKGYTSGDGSGTDGQGGIAATLRSAGAIGVSITPASAWGRFYPGYIIGRAWL